ncbi:MAG: tetratricopeptide repeat protein, partial [Planctomycetes bacterium]|nr:tetratricopeptide repeat protein [Planctomycetota bacterium]
MVFRLFQYGRQAIGRHPRITLGVVFFLVLAGSAGGVNLWAFYQWREADRAVHAEHWDEARRHIQLCLRVWPASATAHLQAARIDRLAGDYQEAETHLEECRRLQGEATEATQLEWLLLRAQQGDVDEVSGDLLAAIQAGHPESALILEALARAYMREGRYWPARYCLTQWLEREPDTVRALHWRGLVLEKLEQRPGAIQDYRRALELAPERSDIRLHLAEALVNESMFREALPHLEQLHRQDPDQPDVLVGLARCRFQMGQLAEARRLLKEALAHHPDHAMALLHLGKLELATGHPQEAEVLLRRAAQVDPYHLEIHYNLQQSLEHQPLRHQEAAAELEVYQKLKKDQDRLAFLLRKQLDQGPPNAEVASEIGAILLRTGQEALGLHWLRKALRIDPGHKPTREVLARY